MIGAIVGEYFGGPIEALGVQILNAVGAPRNFAHAWAAIVVASAPRDRLLPARSRSSSG